MKRKNLKRSLCLGLCLAMLLGLFSVVASARGRNDDIQYLPAQTKSPLTDSIEAMKAEIDALPAAGALRNGRVRLSDFTQSANGSNDVKELRGKHFLVHGENNNHYIIDGSWTGSNGEVPMKIGTHVDGDAAYFTANASPTGAFEFHYQGISSNGMPLYVLRFNNGRNLAVGTKYANWNNLYYVKGDTTADLNAAPQVRLEHPNGVNWVRISNATGTHGFRQNSEKTYIRWKDNGAGDNDYAGNAMFLYRIWSTREILTAIRDMRSYLDTPEFFDEAVLAELLVSLRGAIDLFWQYNSWPASLVDPYDFIQEKLDAKEAELRSFSSRLSFDFKEPSAASLEAKTTIHQLPLACGYVIRTREGKIIVIDGGWQENNTEGTYLFRYLQNLTGDPTPHINAWFITHAHADHHGCVPTFANLYKDQVTIDAFYYHYPTYDEIRTYLSGCGVDDTWGAVDWLPTWLLPNFKNAQGGQTLGIQCNTKQSGKCNNAFDFDDVHIEILLTFEDVIWAVENIGGRYSGTSANEGRVFSNKTLRELLNDNFNETSMVFRVTVGGKSILFTGDINFIGGQMLNMFHDENAANPDNFFTLKSDYVQVSHHGHYGLPKNSYYKIDADVAMWPCNYDEWNDYDYQNLICTKQWFNNMGAKSYVAYQGPHIFEFPLVRSGATITIPSDLKDYVFNAEYYSNKYPDLKALYGNDAKQLYYHFVNYGIEEGRSASPFFDVKHYANQNGHRYVDTFKGNYLAAFQDFLSVYNTSNIRRLSDIFDAGAYVYVHNELIAQGYTTNLSLLKHYVENGYKIGEIATGTILCPIPNPNYHTNCSAIQPVPPTCTTEGSTAGVWCNGCGLVFQYPTVIPATGHDFSNGACACGLEMDAYNLFFDFTNTSKDQARYTHTVYGGYNFDRSDSPYWATGSAGGSTKLSIDNGAGTMRVNVLAEPDSAGNYGPFLKTTNTPGTYPWSGEEYRIYDPLRYDPKDAEYLQIRFKLEGCTGTDKQAKVVVCYQTEKDGVRKSFENLNAVFDPNSTDYQVINIPLTEESFRGADLLTALGFRFRDVKGKGGNGSVIIDYIFVGKMDDAPAPMYDVTFLGADGTVLSTALVAEGGTAQYLGKTPTKAYDKNNHYTFVGWDKALTNITGHTTFTAVFAADAHSYSYSSADGQNHAMACACGYSSSEAHSYAWSMSKEPTVSSAGSLTGACKLCSANKTVAVPKLSEADYTKTTVVAPTCTGKGSDSYEWKERAYGTYSFTVATEALGHAVQIVPGQAATCLSSGISDGEICSRCSVTLKAQTVLPRLGHNYVYTDLGQNHEARCSRCDKASTSAHSYENGVCICGKNEFAQPVLDPSMKLSHSLNLASDISVNYVVPKTLLAGYDMSTVYVECTMDVYSEEFYMGTTTVKLLPEEMGSYYYFILTGITAVQMVDSIFSVL